MEEIKLVSIEACWCGIANSVESSRDEDEDGICIICNNCDYGVFDHESIEDAAEEWNTETKTRKRKSYIPLSTETVNYQEPLVRRPNNA